MLDLVYVSHDRFNTAVVCMGAAFAGISFWITDMQSSALNERIERMENRFAETWEDHMKVITITN